MPYSSTQLDRVEAPRVLIVAEHASMQFGGEASLPVHYFRGLRQRGIPAWLVVHARTRDELEALFPDDRDRLYFVPDTLWHRGLHQLGLRLPHRLSYITTGYISRLLTQLIQRQIVRRLVKTYQIQVVHQPIPVSPKEPSMLFGVGAPVIIGPMNGGMNYPSAFQNLENPLVQRFVGLGRQVSNGLNWLMPGKRLAATLLVANDRTRCALPRGIRGRVLELVENGVDVDLWRSSAVASEQPEHPLKLVFVGRLVDWKGVDMLLSAVQQAAQQVSVELNIIGDGPQRPVLEQQANRLGLLAPDNHQTDDRPLVNQAIVRFMGWLSQVRCAYHLQSAHVLVLPSLYECGGAVVMEAMTMGLPVIATRWGGPAEYLDESCGILVSPTVRESFIDGLASAIVELARSPSRRRRLGEAAQRKALSQFDWNVKIDRILTIYQDTIYGQRIAHKTPAQVR